MWRGRYNFLMNLLLLGAVIGCAFHEPASPPRLTVSEGPLRTLPSADSATPLLAVRAGSAYDPSGREGLARVAAGIAEAHGLRLQELGPEIALFQVDPQKAPDLTAWLQAPTLAAAELAAVVQSLSAPPSCEEIAEAAMDRWQFSGHPYRGPKRGRLSTLASIRPEEVITFLKARYVKDGMALAGTAIPALDQLSGRLSQRVTPAAMAPPLTTTETLVVKAPSGPCGVVASDAEPDDRRMVRWLRQAWASEQPMVDGQILGMWTDLRVQRPLRLAGDPARILDRAQKGWEPATWQAVERSDFLSETLSHLLVLRPDTVSEPPADPNALVRQWFVEGPHRVVVVTGDVTEYLDGEGKPRPGVRVVVTPEEIFE